MAPGTFSDASEIGARPARIRVLSGAQRRDANFEPGRPSRMTIGSDPAAALRIERPDVAPRQLDVIWDGSQLWIQDALRLGRTFVNGVTLNEWVCIAGNAIVCFAGVRLWMTSHAAPTHRVAPDFSALDRARLNSGCESACVRLRDTGRFTLPPELAALREPDAP